MQQTRNSALIALGIVLSGMLLCAGICAATAAGAEQTAPAPLDAQLTLQPAKVPHWVRGAEQGELLE